MPGSGVSTETRAAVPRVANRRGDFRLSGAARPEAAGERILTLTFCTPTG